MPAATPAPPFAPEVQAFLSRVRLGPRQAYKALTVWPLLREGGLPEPPAGYEPLAAALAQRSLHVDEVDAGGSVPHVRVSNAGERAVLFLFGEEIRGAKQNRVANATFLVPAHAELVLDVTCVEAERWERRSGAGFRGAEELVSQALRRKMAVKVAHSRARGRGFRADQGEVWDEVEARLQLARASSPTRAYADYRASRETDLHGVMESFHSAPDQVGFVACIGDEVAGLEAVGSSEVFAAVFQPLLRAYAIDAVDAALVRSLEGRPGGGTGPHFDAPEPFLEALVRAPCTRTRSLGAGDDLRLAGPPVTGCALVHGGLVHLTAFPTEGYSH